MKNLIAIGSLTLALAGTPALAGPVAMTFASDTEFLAFEEQTVGNVTIRRGNGLAESGDWEAAIRGAEDIGSLTSGQSGIAWNLSGSNALSGGTGPFVTYAPGSLSYSFDYDTGTVVQTASGVSDAGDLDPDALVNTIAIRLVTTSEDTTATLSGVSVLAGGDTFNFSDFFGTDTLVGDASAEYFVLADDLFNDGFELFFESGSFDITDDSSNPDSRPSIQVKLGFTPIDVPVPASLALLGLGLAGLGVARRRG